jgi:SAM-dependent methyltransferase
MKKKKHERSTRGVGLLEGFLAKKRSRQADAAIPGSLRGGRLLDIGCGTFPYFLEGTEFKEKYGMDQSEEIAGYYDLPGADHSIRLLRWDFAAEDHLPFDDGFFDVITMLAVFEHIEPVRLVPLVSEIRRTLKTGGLFFLTTPAGWTDRLLRLLARLKLVSAVEIADHKDSYTHGKITRVLEKGGFKRDNITLGYFECFMNNRAAARK